MNLVQGYLRHPHPILSLLILGVVLGILSFRELPLNLFPDANYPRIIVVLQLPGVSAEDIEKEVALPVEKELATLSLVRKVRSVSRDNVAVVSVEFEYEKGLSAAKLDVSSALDRIISNLPKGLLPPRIFKVSDATSPVMTIAITPKEDSNLNLAQVRRLAEEYIKPSLLNIPQIGDVEVFGGYVPEVLIEIHRDTLSRYGLSLADIASAIYAENLNLPSGVIRTSQKEIFLKIAGELKTPEELSDLAVPLKKGGSLRLGDLAKIRLFHADRQSLFHGNGIPAIALNILRPENGNVIATIEAAKKALKRLSSEYPELCFSIVDTQEEIIQTSVSNLVGALRDAIILTVLVIFLIMARLRATLLAAVSIPVTYFLTFFLMKLFGMELNIVTMTAVILAVGLLVDDSIVVAENIERHLRERNISPKEVAISATQEIMLADLSGTFTTVLVLIPIMFVGGYVEKILRELCVVLTMALCSSYVVSITVIPLLAPYVLRKEEALRVERRLSRASEAILNILRSFYLVLFRFGTRYKLFFILLAIGLLAISVKKIIPLVGRDLMPPMDTGIIKVSFEVAPNTPIEETEKIISKLETVIKETPGFIRMATVMGSEPGVISFGADRTPHQGLITAHFVDRFHRKASIWEIEERLYRQFLKIPGLKNIHVFEFGATPLSTIAAPVDIMISGREPKVLHQLALEIEKRLYQVPGITSLSHTWDFDREEYLLVPDLEKLSNYGLSPEALSRNISAAFSGILASLWRIPEEHAYGIRLRFPENQRAFIEDLLDLSISTTKGPIPLRELAKVKKTFSRGVIVREDLSPVIDVLGFRKKTAISHIQAGIKKALKGFSIPHGYKISQEGESKPMKESFARLGKALIISLILLYFSLVPTFHSFRHPVTIMVAIPLALIGAIWGLLLVGRHFCMPASMGMILLSGVVVNNSILLLDFIERARKNGAHLYEAIEKAIQARTRPIIMTALSTIAGMIPIAAEQAIGLERLSPLAVVAIGGLLVGTVLTLVYVPLFYVLLDRLYKNFVFKAQNTQKN